MDIIWKIVECVLGGLFLAVIASMLVFALVAIIAAIKETLRGI